MYINVDPSDHFTFTDFEVSQIQNITPYELAFLRAVDFVLKHVERDPSLFFPTYFLDAFKVACEHNFDAPHSLHLSDLLAGYALFRSGLLDESELFKAANTSYQWYSELLGYEPYFTEEGDSLNILLFDENGEVPF